MKFSGSLGAFCVAAGWGEEGGRPGLGGADALIGLSEVSFGGFLTVRTIS